MESSLFWICCYVLLSTVGYLINKLHWYMLISAWFSCFLSEAHDYGTTNAVCSPLHFFSCNSPKSQLGNNFFSRANSCISLGHQAWYKSQWNIWQVKGNVLTHIFTTVKSSYIDGLTNFCSSCPLQWGCRQAWQSAI